MPEITKELLKAALDCYHERLVLTLSIVEPLRPPGDIDRMFRDVDALQKQLTRMLQAELDVAYVKARSKLDDERLQKQRTG